VLQLPNLERRPADSLHAPESKESAEMGLIGRKWTRIAVATTACCLGAAAMGYSQFTSFSDRTGALLEGNWQSCREADGKYSERVYDNKLPGIGAFELHMGPYHEFALFRGVQDEHRAHDSSANLLHPYNVEVVGNLAHQKWETSGVLIEVTLAGGSREECESWFVSLRRLDTSSH
jgi:hypothetical protein